MFGNIIIKDSIYNNTFQVVSNINSNKIKTNTINLKNITSISGDIIIDPNDNLIVKSNTLFENDISINGTIYHSGNFDPIIGSGSINLSQVLLNGNYASTDIDMSNNSIVDVSGINFSDGTYIGSGSSFDIFSNENILLLSNKNIILEPSGNVTITKDLIFENSGNNVMTFSNFSSNTQNTQLPSINNQPISLTRISIFNNDISYNVSSGSEKIMPFGSIIKNQIKLSINPITNIISPSLDISGQYIEIYSDIEIFTTNNSTDFSLDISGVGCDFFEIIDCRSVGKKNKKFYLTFGPHIFLPEQWVNCTQFVFKIVDNINSSFDVIRTKIVFKSYYL